MSERVKAMVADQDNRRFLRQAQDRLFDCAAHGVSSFAQDDSSVRGANEEQMRGFFASLRMTSVESEEDDEDSTPFDKLREECGIMAVYGHPDAARMTYWGLYALQHRGQESAGIASADGHELNDIKGMGLVSEIFTDEVLARLPGHMAIGHTRYSTTGDSALLNAQPISV